MPAVVVVLSMRQVPLVANRVWLPQTIDASSRLVGLTRDSLCWRPVDSDVFVRVFCARDGKRVDSCGGVSRLRFGRGPPGKKDAPLAFGACPFVSGVGACFALC